MTSALGIIAGSAASPGLYISGDTNTGIWSSGADIFGIATGGVARMEVNATGLVNIGQTSLTSQFGVQSGSTTRVTATLKAAASQTANVLELTSSSNALLASIDAANGRMSLNRAAVVATTVLNIQGGNNERVDTTGTARGIFCEINNQSSGDVYVMRFIARSTYVGSGQRLTGMGGVVTTQTAGCNISIGEALVADSPSIINGTLTTAYGLLVNAQKTTNVTNGWAIYASGASDNSYFAGNVLIGGTTVPASAAGCLVLHNAAAVPTGNITGGTLYSESGALKWRGSSGTITTIANA